MLNIFTLSFCDYDVVILYTKKHPNKFNLLTVMYNTTKNFTTNNVCCSFKFHIYVLLMLSSSMSWCYDAYSGNTHAQNSSDFFSQNIITSNTTLKRNTGNQNAIFMPQYRERTKYETIDEYKSQKRFFKTVAAAINDIDLMLGLATNFNSTSQSINISQKNINTALHSLSELCKTSEILRNQLNPYFESNFYQQNTDITNHKKILENDIKSLDDNLKDMLYYCNQYEHYSQNPKSLKKKIEKIRENITEVSRHVKNLLNTHQSIRLENYRGLEDVYKNKIQPSTKSKPEISKNQEILVYKSKPKPNANLGLKQNDELTINKPKSEKYKIIRLNQLLDYKKTQERLGNLNKNEKHKSQEVSKYQILSHSKNKNTYNIQAQQLYKQKASQRHNKPRIQVGKNLQILSQNPRILNYDIQELNTYYQKPQEKLATRSNIEQQDDNIKQQKNYDFTQKKLQKNTYEFQKNNTITQEKREHQKHKYGISASPNKLFLQKTKPNANLGFKQNYELTINKPKFAKYKITRLNQLLDYKKTLKILENQNRNEKYKSQEVSKYQILSHSKNKNTYNIQAQQLYKQKASQRHNKPKIQVSENLQILRQNPRILNYDIQKLDTYYKKPQEKLTTRSNIEQQSNYYFTQEKPQKNTYKLQKNNIILTQKRNDRKHKYGISKHTNVLALQKNKKKLHEVDNQNVILKQKKIEKTKYIDNIDQIVLYHTENDRKHEIVLQNQVLYQSKKESHNQSSQTTNINIKQNNYESQKHRKNHSIVTHKNVIKQLSKSIKPIEQKNSTNSLSIPVSHYASNTKINKVHDIQTNESSGSNSLYNKNSFQKIKNQNNHQYVLDITTHQIDVVNKIINNHNTTRYVSPNNNNITQSFSNSINLWGVVNYSEVPTANTQMNQNTLLSSVTTGVDMLVNENSMFGLGYQHSNVNNFKSNTKIKSTDNIQKLDGESIQNLFFLYFDTQKNRVGFNVKVFGGTHLYKQNSNINNLTSRNDSTLYYTFAYNIGVSKLFRSPVVIVKPYIEIDHVIVMSDVMNHNVSLNFGSFFSSFSPLLSKNSIYLTPYVDISMRHNIYQDCATNNNSKIAGSLATSNKTKDQNLGVIGLVNFGAIIEKEYLTLNIGYNFGVKFLQSKISVNNGIQLKANYTF